MSFFWKIILWILDKMKIIGAACLVGMMLLTCVDVVGRSFGHPIFGSVEIVGFMATLAVVMAMPYTHQVQGHIGVEIGWPNARPTTSAQVNSIIATRHPAPMIFILSRTHWMIFQNKAISPIFHLGQSPTSAV